MATAGTSSRAALRRLRTSAAQGDSTGQKVGANFIPHVQGLRAIAVLAVVLYHFWPGRLTGGYVGVDIFFVISGFLITAHLARELEATGRVNLGQFWARRARRLLPASLLVLLFCVYELSFTSAYAHEQQDKLTKQLTTEWSSPSPSPPAPHASAIRSSTG